MLASHASTRSGLLAKTAEYNPAGALSSGSRLRPQGCSLSVCVSEGSRELERAPSSSRCSMCSNCQGLAPSVMDPLPKRGNSGSLKGRALLGSSRSLPDTQALRIQDGTASFSRCHTPCAQQDLATVRAGSPVVLLWDSIGRLPVARSDQRAPNHGTQTPQSAPRRRSDQLHLGCQVPLLESSQPNYQS